MQATAFDGITRDLGEGSTRRRFLRLLGGTMAIGLGAAALDGPAAAERRAGKQQTGQKGKGKGKGKVCRSWILSGGPSPTEPIGVDDDLQVTLNGVTILNDGNNVAGNLPPVPFRANVGDSLAVTARDVNPACRALSPLWLHCATNGQKRQLSAGQNDGCAPGRTPGIFFNQVYRIKRVKL